MTVAPAGSLGYLTKLVSPGREKVPRGVRRREREKAKREREKRISEARKRRFRLQGNAADLLPDERVSWCLKRLKDGTSGVDILYDESHGVAHYGNLIACGSIWICAVCAAKISEKRRVELSEALENNPHLTPILVTFTLQHERDDTLRELKDALNGAYRHVKSGKAWYLLRDKFGLEASITALEVTWGYAAGWHPHKHVLFFSDLPLDELDVDELQRRLTARFAGHLERKGRYASAIYGVDVRLGGDVVKPYVSKWGLEHEVAKSTVKNGKAGLSPFQLLDLYGEGKTWAGGLFVEYARTMKGCRQLSWSKGGRALLGLVEEEKTDEELADEQEEHAVVLATLTFEQWRLIVANDARAEVLEVASAGDAAKLWDFLNLFIRGP